MPATIPTRVVGDNRSHGRTSTCLVACVTAAIAVGVISPKAEATPREKPAAVGPDVPAYAAALIERMAKPPLSLREITGLVFDEFMATDMTDDELGDLLEDTKHRERQQPRSGR